MNFLLLITILLKKGKMMICGRGCSYDQQLKITADLMSSFNSDEPYSNSSNIGNDFQQYNDM